MNRVDLRVLSLAGPTGTSLVLDPLALQYLDNRLYMPYHIYQVSAMDYNKPKYGITASWTEASNR